MLLETPSRIEPCLLDAYPKGLADLIAELVAVATGLGVRGSLPTSRRFRWRSCAVGSWRAAKPRG
jgi:hypothetical protein